MNTIIIHPNNRPIHTAMHDLSAALISPVSKWYRKPMPWWVDGFEEMRLVPISEADEGSELDESLLEGLAGKADALKDVKLYSNRDEDEFDTALNDIYQSHVDIPDTPCDSGSRFIENISGQDGENSVLVDHATFMEILQEVENDGEVDAFADMSFSDEGITLVLEWHESIVSVVVELNARDNSYNNVVLDESVAWKPKLVLF